MQPSHSNDNLFISLIKKLEPASKKPSTHIKTSKKEISKSLADLSVYCQARHFPDFEDKSKTSDTFYMFILLTYLYHNPSCNL